MPVQAPEALFAHRFGQFSRPEVQFSSQKHITAQISLGSAPVLAPRARFFSGFCYKSVEEQITDAREVGLHAEEVGNSFMAIRNIPSTSPLLSHINRGHSLLPKDTPTLELQLLHPILVVVSL